jgi:hypothetical protein
MLLDYKARIIAGGTIVKVKAGSDGGGRLAAAKTLAKFGRSIKLPSDGEIRGFKHKNARTGVAEFFTVA